ncbi:serine hydrolase domain-containing protein [Phenylobacterium kunshanense]|uniref:Serine hydrolase n=1 Tax=Phenylobacterium kunshanense TaxID=1445034 RepID=A0A328BAX7_9CAUL|nr:serine hydrolase domain-containing protein [Phenylobacterium kunshanense]RAK63621.1 serine hydrolase [Phenylobacterium kunshanense]
MRSLGKAILFALAILAAAPAAAQDTGAAPAPDSRAQATNPAPPSTLSPAPTAVAAPGVTPLDPVRLEAFVDGWMTDAMNRAHVAGASVAVVQNGQVVLKKGYGFADLNPRRPVDPDRTLFRIGSVSKTFTWILVMKEVEAGRIRLDRPINLYLPEKVRLPGRLREVTVRNLMEHTPGLEDRALGQLFENDPRRVRPLDLYLRQERPGRDRSPGILSSYSNYGVGLAGAAVALGEGKSFERLVEEDITLPLGMRYTTFREPRPERRGLPAAMPAALRPHVSAGFGWRTAGFVENDYEYIGHIAPAGSASSTAGDMSRYMLMLLGDGSWNGATVFGPVAARAFRSPLRQTTDGMNGWAHGFIVYDLPGGHKGYGHDGATIAFHTKMVVVPDLGLGVFITTNSENGHRLSRAFPDAVVQHFYAQPQTFPRPPSRELGQSADMFTGSYLTTRRANGGLEGFVGLLVGASEVVVQGGRLLTGQGGEVKSWVPDGPLAQGRFIATTGNERLFFRLEDGRAVSYRDEMNAFTMKRAALTERASILALGAGLTVFAAVATFAGLALRNRRELRQNQIQARASMVQTMQAGLWIAAFGLFAAFADQALDIQKVMYGWPGPLLIAASACALVAAALTLVTIAALPAVWQGGRRVDSWTAPRKTFFTLTVLIYALFSVLLAMNGALEPWSR